MRMEYARAITFDNRHLPKCERGQGCKRSLTIDRIKPGVWRVCCNKCRVAVEGGTYERTLEMYRKASA